MALSVGKLIHHGELLLPAPDPAAADRKLSTTLKGFRMHNAEVWRRKPLKLVQAVILHISTNIHITTSNTWLWGTYTVIDQLKHNCSDQQNVEIETMVAQLQGIAGTTRY